MAAAGSDWAGRLLDFWFETLEPSDWFGSSEVVDAQLRDRFEADLHALSDHPAELFLTDPQSARAAVLLFDQLPRNLYRGTARAFACDSKARAIAKEIIAKGWDAPLPDRERQFVAMPLMHSEDLADQEASLDYFGTHLPANLDFARSHHAMIARFGRFPHRNAALGRDTSPEEQQAIDDGFAW